MSLTLELEDGDAAIVIHADGGCELVHTGNEDESASFPDIAVATLRRMYADDELFEEHWDATVAWLTEDDEPEALN